MYKIFIAGDDESSLDVITSTLCQQGFTTTRGKEPTSPPDCILINFSSTEPSNVTLISQLKLRYPKARCIALTAPQNHGSYRHCDVMFAAGANAVLRKPINLSLLLKTIQQLLTTPKVGEQTTTNS